MRIDPRTGDRPTPGTYKMITYETPSPFAPEVEYVRVVSHRGVTFFFERLTADLRFRSGRIGGIGSANLFNDDSMACWWRIFEPVSLVVQHDGRFL